MTGERGVDLKTTYHLEMSSSSRLEPGRPTTELVVRRVEIPCPELNWFLHEMVGVEFRWGGREDWGRADWTEYVDRLELETWVAHVSGCPAGYFELEKKDDGSVRIQCFGLCRPFLGKGLGGHFLTVAVQRSWELTDSRVWLNTCSHDHPRALRNYLARGFRLVKETRSPANSPQRSLLFGGE